LKDPGPIHLPRGLSLGDIEQIIETAREAGMIVQEMRTALASYRHERVFELARRLCGLPPDPGRIVRTPEWTATLTPKEVAKRTGFSLSAVYKLLKSGEMPHIRQGKIFKIPVAALEQWLARVNGKPSSSTTANGDGEAIEGA
jgi:excisionase family DNA binding protein